MSDLRCTRCGTEASYADANIADLRRTCEETREVRTQYAPGEPSRLREVTAAAEHEWIEL